jgi:hypothetical protein
MPQTQTNAELGPGVINFDYERWFPHIFWVSQWTSDDSLPDGYCYKLLSVRDESVGQVELVVLLTERNGYKSEMHRFSVPTEQARSAGRDWAAGLTKRFSLDFEEQDYSAIRTRDDFNVTTQKYGWTMQPNETGIA